MSRNERTIINLYEAAFEPYDLEGPIQDDMGLLSVSYDRGSRRGIYAIRMEPGAATIPHTHECMEEFLILEGELIESDGTVLKKGDLTSYRSGSRHNSRTETGCLLVGIDWDPPDSE
ncbi:MAG: cupin domain-containing protein [Chromatiales bacterium]|nr:cupin domain-containing protein [Chromatiales bacterium]